MNKLAVILSDIRSTYNVGSVMRSADCFGVSHIFFCGITPYPLTKSDKRLPHLSKKISNAIHKTALGAEKTINFTIHNDSLEAIDAAKEMGYKVAAIEQSSKSLNLIDYKPPNNLAIILGNEVSGLSMQTLEASDVILEIPMLGKKESLNVSITAAIVMYTLRFKAIK